MQVVLYAFAAVLLSQAPAEEPKQTDESAAEAARRAADAAEKAAAAAERSAAAVEELVRRGAPQGAAAAPAAAAAGAPKKAIWNSSVGFSLIAMAGNSDTLTFSTTGSIERRGEDFVLSAKAGGAYGQTRVEGDAAASVVALNAMSQVRVDYKLTTIASAFLLGGADTDHVKSIDYRTYAEGGAAVIWIERQEGTFTRLLLRTDLGLRYAYESRYQFFPTPTDLADVTLIAPKLGLGFRYAVNENVQFVEEAEVMTNVAGAPRFIFTSLSRISAKLTKSLSLSVGLQVNHDSAPAAGKEPTDTTLSAGFDIAF